MNDHPSPTALEAFLRSELGTQERRAVLAHLLGGCQRCRETMASSVADFFGPGLQRAQGEGTEYDAALDRAFGKALERAAELDRERAADGEAPALQARRAGRRRPEPLRKSSARRAWTRCERAIEEAVRMRHQDPMGMLDMAVVAVALSDRLDPQDYGEGAVFDLHARAWAELGNARRVNDDLVDAERDFQFAALLAQQGTGDQLLLARVLDLTASLYRAQRRFEEAFQLLDAVYAIHLDRRDFHLAGKALINKGLAKGYANEPQEGIVLLSGGINWVDAEKDPRLHLAAVHNLILLHVETERFAEARNLVRSHRDLYTRLGDSMLCLKLRWVEGKISAGLGDLGPAETALREVRNAFAERGLAYDAALASFDLAALCLRQGRTGEVIQLLEEALATFRALGIGREAIAALMMLKEAVATERGTLDLVRRVAARFSRLEREGSADWL